MIKSITSLSGEVAKGHISDRERKSKWQRERDRKKSSKKALQWQSRTRCDGEYERA
jgi:hypothetical protein